MENIYLEIFNKYHKEIVNKLDKEMNKFNNSIIDKDDNKIIKSLLKDFIDLNSNGKYIRATLIGLAYNNYIKKDDYLDLAVAYETFQTSVLVHDDITDKAGTRRNKKTIHTRIKEKYNDLDKDDVYDFSNALATWTGNLGYFITNKLIVDSYKNNKYLSNIISKYNDIVIKTIKGEIIDIDLPFESKYLNYLTKEEDVLDIYRLKTAHYTIIGPYELGLSIVGKEISKELKQALEYIGICFQIKDDILGVFGDSKIIGKPNLSDVEECKQTILYTYTLKTKYKDKLLKYYGKKITEKELEKVRNIFIESKALEYAEDLMTNLINKAFICLEEDKELTKETKDILKGLIIFIESRQK